MDDDNRTPGILIDRMSEMSCADCGCDIDCSEVDPFTEFDCPQCGHGQTVPARLGSFLLLKLIGMGGMGGVYHAKDESLGRFVAIKVMLASLGEDKEFVENFKREAQAAAKLNHPHIAQIYSFGEEKGQPYIVMELVPGKGLDKLMEERGPLDQDLVFQIGLEIAEGLSEADEIGLIHGDIKPENILLDDKMQAKLVDFGIATYAGQAQGDQIWGTPYYIAPEKVKRHKADARSDIYCLGASLYHALAGRPPFDGDTPVEVVKARLEHAAPPLNESREDIDDEYNSIIARMLEADPKVRYPTYASLISDMRKAWSERTSSVGSLSNSNRRMIVKKKRTITVSSAKAPGPGSAPAQTAGKSAMRVQRPGAAGGAVTRMTTSPASGSTSSTASRPAKKKGSAVKVVLWLLLVLLLIGGGVGAFLYRKAQNEAKIAARREAFALADRRQEAVTAFEKVAAVVSSIRMDVEEARTYADLAIAAVYAVRSETLTIPEPVYEPAAAEPEPEPPAEEEEPDAAGTGADAGDGAGEAGTGNGEPAGPGEGGEGEAAAGDDGASTEEAPAEPEEPEPVPVIPDTEDRIQARRAISATTNAMVILYRAGKAEAEAADTREEAVQANTSAVSAARVEDLGEALETVKGLKEKAAQAVKTAKDAMQRTEAMREKIEREGEAQRKAAQEAARRRAEEEAARREEERLEQQTEEELARVRALREENLPLIREHRYKDARDAVAARRDGFETKKGKAAIKTLHERYSLLEALFEAIVANLKSAPFSWGWGVPRGSADVTGASRTGVRVKGQTIPWAQISTAQMLKFINHALDDDTLGFKERGDHTLAAALFCFENGGNEAALRYAEKAVGLLPTLEDDIERFFPLDDE